MMQVHVLSRVMANVGLLLLKHVPLHIVDSFLAIWSRLTYGDLTRYGIKRPEEGPFLMKGKYGKYPFIDVGTCAKIKSGEIQVTNLPHVSLILEAILKGLKIKIFMLFILLTPFINKSHYHFSCSYLNGEYYL